MSKIRIFALGGLNEGGKNMYIVDVDNDIFVFDAGLKYDNDLNLGIDYILPNINYLVENKDRIKGIFVTHGHEANFGAIPDILEQIPEIKIYASKLTNEIIKRNLRDDLQKSANLIELEANKMVIFGNNFIFPMRVTHSIPDAFCYVLNTQDGAIVYTGDFTFDVTMKGAYETDIGKLAHVGKKGVLCLLCESWYADMPGHTSPHDRVADFIHEVLLSAEDRVIATVFPSHFYRVQEIFDEAVRTRRNIIIMGKALQAEIMSAINENYLTIDTSRILSLDHLNDKNVVVLVSDLKERPFANLNKIINGKDKFIFIKQTDTVFITEPSYPGIEKQMALVMDEISMLGANAVSLSSKEHLSHHASQEDLMMMLNLLKPKYYFPVKGEYRLQYANAMVAQSMGISPDNIILKQNGDVVEFVDGVMQECFDKIDNEPILIDGKSEDPIGEMVLKDREALGQNGIVIICCSIDKQTKEILSGPETMTRGFVYVKESQEFLEQTKAIAKEIIEDNIAEYKNHNQLKVDFAKIKTDIRDRLSKFFYEETETNPMIISVVLEV